MLTHVSLLALAGLVSGCGLVLTAMITKQWIFLPEDTYYGLFSFCSSTTCTSINFTTETATPTRNRQSHFKAIRGLVITGLIVSICGSLMALGFVVDAIRSKGVKSLALLRSSLVLNPLGGVLTLLGASVFAGSVHGTAPDSVLGFSFALCACGGTLTLISGVLVYVGGPRKVTASDRRLSSAQAVLACMQPPPHYTCPSEEYLVAQFKPPPAYEVKVLPPTYEEVLMLPPTYEEA